MIAAAAVRSSSALRTIHGLPSSSSSSRRYYCSVGGNNNNAINLIGRKHRHWCFFTGRCSPFSSSSFRTATIHHVRHHQQHHPPPTALALFSSSSSSARVVTCLLGCITGMMSAADVVATSGGGGKWPTIVQMEAQQQQQQQEKDGSSAMDAESQSLVDELMEFLGLKQLFGSGGNGASSSSDNDDGGNNNESKMSSSNNDILPKEEKEGNEGPGKPVIVHLDTELLDSLPTLPLSVVQHPTGDYRNRHLVSHDGIVYDITEFVNHHPGGRDLILTASGLDMHHFFANYTVHGNTDKAANWLANMAVGKLSKEDAAVAKSMTTSAVHVERRHEWLTKARTRIVVIAATLPVWMTVRSCVRLVGWILPSLGRFLAMLVPVAVPGLSIGAEPLTVKAKGGGGGGGGSSSSISKEDDENTLPDVADDAPTVAVIGGGIAGCGTAWSLRQSGFRVTLFEARNQISGNARTFDWDFSAHRPNSKKEEQTVKSCCSVTAWPPLFYKNYTCLLNKLDVQTVHQPLSWFLNSKVPGAEGTLWGADPTPYEGSLRSVLKKDFDIYGRVVRFSDTMCNLFTLRWAPWRRNDTPSMYDSHTGIGLLNPMNIVPLYSLFRLMGGSELWWQVVFTPHYTASFLVDELRPFPAVFGPLIEAQIPLLPNKDNAQLFRSSRSENDCNITTCQTSSLKFLIWCCDGLAMMMMMTT